MSSNTLRRLLLISRTFGNAALNLISRRYVPPYVDPVARRRGIVVKHAPTIANIELTNKCPFRCVMCARTHHMTRAEGLMEFGVFQRIIDELLEINASFARHRPVWLHGFGESLVHPEFDRFIRYASSNGVQAALSINPLLLTPSVAERLLKARPHLLYCSLDGHDDASFAQIRGVQDAYENSKSRLLEFLRKKTAGNYKTRIVLSMINFPLNRPSIDQMMSSWKATPGIDKVLSKPFVTWDGKADDVSALAPANSRDRDPDSEVTCSTPWTRLTVKWDGDVVPCCYDYNKRYVVGNVCSESLAEIWNGQRMQALREEFIANDVRNPLCEKCPQLRS